MRKRYFLSSDKNIIVVLSAERYEDVLIFDDNNNNFYFDKNEVDELYKILSEEKIGKYDISSYWITIRDKNKLLKCIFELNYNNCFSLVLDRKEINKLLKIIKEHLFEIKNSIDLNW